jgi:hypothetical protein
VATESSGVFWKPVYNLLEGLDLALLVVKAQQIKAVPGRKTDVEDAPMDRRPAAPRLAPRQLHPRARTARTAGVAALSQKLDQPGSLVQVQATFSVKARCSS